MTLNLIYITIWVYDLRKLDIGNLISQNYSVFLFGPRGVGKTALLNQLENIEIRYDLLNGELLRSLTLDPSLFRAQCTASAKRHSGEGLPHIVVIDEVQLLPGILNDVHSLIEQFRKQLSFVMTGSSARKLRRGDANMLAGRAITRNLFPLTLSETSLDLHRALQFGTLPRPYLNDPDPKPYLTSYVDTYLREEIKQESFVRKVDAFIRFLDLAAQLNSENINFSKLGRQCGVASSTIEQYYSILEDTLLVNRIDGWSHSIKKQLVVGPRYYFYDCGVLNAIRRELHLELSSHSFRFGKLFETFMINQVRAYCAYTELDYKFHYWRTNSGLEVDMILSRSAYNPPIAIEFKGSASPELTDILSSLTFKEENEGAKLFCVCTTHSPYEKKGIQFVPWQKLDLVSRIG